MRTQKASACRVARHGEFIIASTSAGPNCAQHPRRHSGTIGPALAGDRSIQIRSVSDHCPTRYPPRCAFCIGWNRYRRQFGDAPATPFDNGVYPAVICVARLSRTGDPGLCASGATRRCPIARTAQRCRTFSGSSRPLRKSTTASALPFSRPARSSPSLSMKVLMVLAMIFFTI